jgi:hypothetical protein
MDNNLNITPISAQEAKEAWDSLPDPLSPPRLTRQTGYYKQPNRLEDSDSPPPLPRMSGYVELKDEEEEDEEIDLEGFLKGLVLKQTKPKKKPVLKTFLPSNDTEKNIKNIMKIFGSEINSNVKYYESLRREQGFLTTKNGEDIILMHNNLRQKTIQKIDQVLEKNELTENATEYVEACFKTQLKRIKSLHPKSHSFTC